MTLKWILLVVFFTLLLGCGSGGGDSSNSANGSGAVSFKAWLGSADSEISFPSSLGNFILHTTSTSDCDMQTVAGCESKHSDRHSGETISHLSLTVDTSPYLALESSASEGVFRAQNEGDFPPRYGHQIVFFKEKLWLLGGGDNSAEYNDVWSTSDGVNWKREIEMAAFSARKNHQVFVFKDTLWLVAGMSAASELNDIWSSEDGINWVEEKQNAEFEETSGHQIAVFNGRVWLVGGSNTTWSSSDAISWEKITNNLPFESVSGHQALLHEGMLKIVGGNIPDGSEYQPYIWATSDGVSWSQDSYGLSREGHQIVSYNGKLRAIGGLGEAEGISGYVYSFKDPYWTTDGASVLTYTARTDHQAVIFNDGSGEKVWLFGGRTLKEVRMETETLADTWTSDDGLTWVSESKNATYSPRQSHQITKFDIDGRENLVLTGGFDGKRRNDVWVSYDGLEWELYQKHTNSFDRFSPRFRHSTVVFNDRLYVIGGIINLFSASPVTDIWSSSDGDSWREDAASTPFDSANNFQAVVFDNGTTEKLLVFADNEIWSSADGANWTMETARFDTFNRYRYKVVSYNQKLWIISGIRGVELSSSVWSSSDGVSWSQVVEEAPFEARQFHAVKVFDAGDGEKMWLVGGSNGSDLLNDVWSSSNGVDWTLETNAAPFEPRQFHDLEVFNNGQELFLFGGSNDSGANLNDVWKTIDGVNWEKGYQAKLKLN